MDELSKVVGHKINILDLMSYSLCVAAQYSVDHWLLGENDASSTWTIPGMCHSRINCFTIKSYK